MYQDKKNTEVNYKTEPKLIKEIKQAMKKRYRFKKKNSDNDIALKLLELIPAEKNVIIQKWMEHGIGAFSAFDSQALLQLKKKYCDEKKCLRCRIGHKVLSCPQKL